VPPRDGGGFASETVPAGGNVCVMPGGGTNAGDGAPHATRAIAARIAASEIVASGRTIES
jgi:hypothetical protein